MVKAGAAWKPLEPSESRVDAILITMSNKLKVQELRDELAKRGLDTSGLKPALVDRLDTAILDEQKSKDDRISSGDAGLALGRKRRDKPSKKQSLDEDDKIVCTSKRLRGQDVDNQSNEAAGVKRKQNISDTTPTCKDDNEVTASKTQKDKDINDLTVDELQQELANYGLSTSGAKKVLVERLRAAMKDGSRLAKIDGHTRQESENKMVADAECENNSEKKMVVATKKGCAVLDQWLPDELKSGYHVLQIGDVIFDAMLNQTNVGQNNNKFYVIQALEADAGGQYMVYNRWGRVGVKGQDKLFACTSREEAVSEFESKFFDKTKNNWSDRHNFEPYPGKYTWLEMDYEGDKLSTEENEKKPSDPVVNKQLRESKLDDRLAQFISLICNVSMMRQQMMEIGYNANKLPLGKLSKSTILKGYEVLKRIGVAIENPNRHMLEQLSSEFYTAVPHDFGFKKMRDFIIDTPQKLKRKLEMVESLGEIELATKLLKDDNELEEDPIYSLYQRLRCHFLPLEEDSEDVALIKSYLSNTHAETHSHYTLEVLHMFKVLREGEDKCFEKFSKTKNRMLLWHGSRLTNWAGILSQGLRIAPPEAPVTGYMFGKGVYFADMVSKSANYCYASKSCPIGVLLLCEVALGDMVELQEANYEAHILPKGKLSTKGVGGTTPDPLESRILADGVIVPMGRPKKQLTTQVSLLYNEFIVYNVEQIRMRYLLQVKFNFRR